MAKKQSVNACTVALAVADLTDDPANGQKIGRRDSQLLFGETFSVESRDRLWLYGKNKSDGYKGYVHQSSLKPEHAKPTHAVVQLLSALYAQPDFKTRPIHSLSFMSRIAVESSAEKNGFVKVHGGWIYKSHLQKISELKKNKDHTAAALQFLGCPYLYGGRSALGLDCSALVQLSLHWRGLPCLRDSDQQTTVGKKISDKNYKRGDLIFFKGHVGIMVNAKNILNANARTMDVRIEKLPDLVKIYNGIIAARRV